MKSRERYTIIGFGWVGQANALALRQLGYEVNYFDPSKPPRHYSKYARWYESIDRLGKPLDADSPDTWYIVCVGDRVSEDGVQDISSIQKALDSLKGAKGGVILRSTILPDSLEQLPFDYYLPEFLHEKNAIAECIKPPYFVVGIRSKRAQPMVFAYWRRMARKTFEGSPREASLIKYLSNLWNALRIAFVNEFGDAIAAPKRKADIDEVSHVIDFFFSNHSYLRYGRAFGGHCLPKDTRAFLRWRKDKGEAAPLIAGINESNERRVAHESEFPLLPEWFSFWSDEHISGWQALSELRHSVKKNIFRSRPS